MKIKPTHILIGFLIVTLVMTNIYWFTNNSSQAVSGDIQMDHDKTKEQLKLDKEAKRILEPMDITEEVVEAVPSVYEKEEEEYLVYVYDYSCKSCSDYVVNQLNEYTNHERALKVYSVEATESIKEELRLEKPQGDLIHIKNGKEVERFLGQYSIAGLPLGKVKETFVRNIDITTLTSRDSDDYFVFSYNKGCERCEEYVDKTLKPYSETKNAIPVYTNIYEEGQIELSDNESNEEKLESRLYRIINGQIRSVTINFPSIKELAKMIKNMNDE